VKEHIFSISTGPIRDRTLMIDNIPLVTIGVTSDYIGTVAPGRNDWAMRLEIAKKDYKYEVRGHSIDVKVRTMNGGWAEIRNCHEIDQSKPGRGYISFYSSEIDFALINGLDQVLEDLK
jgi:hypothetical protein